MPGWDILLFLLHYRHYLLIVNDNFFAICQTGELVNKVQHSSSIEVESNQHNVEQYGGVTHLKCLPMLPLIVSESKLVSGVRDYGPKSSRSHSAFVSACSIGIVKIWSIVSFEKKVESVVDGEKDRGGMTLIISNQATIKVFIKSDFSHIRLCILSSFMDPLLYHNLI